MKIHRETRTIGFWFWKRKQSRYVADVVIYDTYDFTEWRNDGSLGSIANNIAYIGQMMGFIQPYDWSANFVMATAWENIDE